METINDIIREMQDEVRTSRENNPDPRTRIFLSTSNMAIEDFAARIKDAHTREIAAKDAEIARLTNIINTECNKCGDCDKFGNDCNAGDVDGSEDCRACKKFVSKEGAALRALVKELADKLDGPDQPACINCTLRSCPGVEECRYTKETIALVAKAREEVKDGE